MPPGKVEICRIRANGIDVTAERAPSTPDDFRIPLHGLRGMPGDGVIDLVVEFRGIAATA